MTPFKILFERPHLNQSQSESLMDFKGILSESVRIRKLRRIRKTVLIIALISAGLLTVLYFNHRHNLPFSDYPGIDTLQTGVPGPVGEYKRPEAVPSGKDTLTSRDSSGQIISRLNKNTIPEVKYDTGHEGISALPGQKLIHARPVFGFDSLYAYFNEKLKYPENLLSEKKEGNVIIGFSIDKNGGIENVMVIRKLHPVLDSIAISSVSGMPPWEPATLNGVPITTKLSIPLIFNVDSLK